MNKRLKRGAVFNPDNLDRERILEGPHPEIIWCLHCERTYLRGEYRPINDLQMCPYSDCDGDTVSDAWDWEQIRGMNPNYPEKPEECIVYPMYPK